MSAGLAAMIKKLFCNKDLLTRIKDVWQSCAGALIDPRVQDT